MHDLEPGQFSQLNELKNVYHVAGEKQNAQEANHTSTTRDQVNHTYL